jgi:hypothetical protein
MTVYFRNLNYNDRTASHHDLPTSHKNKGIAKEVPSFNTIDTPFFVDCNEFLFKFCHHLQV